MGEQVKIITAIADSLGIPPNDLDMEASLREDLSLNPVELADLLNGLAQKFAITFEPGEVEGIETVADLVETVEDKLLES